MREDGLAISVFGVLGWLGLLSGALYAAGAAVVHRRWQRNPYLAVTYQDALFAPMRQSILAEKRGRALLAEGQDLFKAGRRAEAAERLQRGLVTFPQDAAARLTLAQHYLAERDAPQALRMLKDGLGERFPGRAYLELLFTIAEAGEDYELIALSSARFIPELKRTGASAELRWLVERRFEALLAAARATEAVTRLAEWRAQPGADARRIGPWQVRALREARAFDAMERALEELRALAPADPEVFSLAVVEQALAGRTEAARVAFDEFVARFGASAENLTGLTVALAAIDEIPLLRRCVEIAIERGHPPQRGQVLLVHTLLHHGDWLGAGRALASIAHESGGDSGATPEWRGWIQGLLACAQSQTESADAAIVTLLRERSRPIGVFRESVQALVRAERFNAARDVLAIASREYPASHWLKATMAEVKLEIMARTEALPADTVPRARVSAEQLFVLRLDDLLRGKKWQEAASHIHQVESLQPAPSWLAAGSSTIWLAQVRIARELRDLPGMLAAARLYLNGEDERSHRLLELARDCFGAGDKGFALGLVREIVSRTPRDAAAQSALDEWEPARAKKGAAAPRVEAVVERAVPPPKRTVELPADVAALLKEVRTRAVNGDMPGMLGKARLILNGDPARAQQVLDVARGRHAAGDRAAALLLAREVLRKDSDFPPALRLLGEWERAGTQ